MGLAQQRVGLAPRLVLIVRGFVVLAMALCVGLEAHAQAGTQVPTSTAVRSDYVCDSGRALWVRYASDAAEVQAGDSPVRTLAQQPSGSGFIYEGEGLRLRGKGREVTLSATNAEADGQPVETCHAVPARR